MELQPFQRPYRIRKIAASGEPATMPSRRARKISDGERKLASSAILRSRSSSVAVSRLIVSPRKLGKERREFGEAGEEASDLGSQLHRPRQMYDRGCVLAAASQRGGEVQLIRRVVGNEADRHLERLFRLGHPAELFERVAEVVPAQI